MRRACGASELCSTAIVINAGIRVATNRGQTHDGIHVSVAWKMSG